MSREVDVFLGVPYRHRRFIVDLAGPGPEIGSISTIYRRYIDDISTIYRRYIADIEPIHCRLAHSTF